MKLNEIKFNRVIDSIIKNKINIVELANKMDISINILSNKIKGKTIFFKKDVDKILSILNEKYNNLFFEKMQINRKINNKKSKNTNTRWKAESPYKNLIELMEKQNLTPYNFIYLANKNGLPKNINFYRKIKKQSDFNLNELNFLLNFFNIDYEFLFYKEEKEK